MSFDFDAPIDRRASDSTKWRRYAGRDVLPLWVADMDFAAPPAVTEALHRRVDHGVFGYTDPPASTVEAVCEALRRDHGWSIEPDWLVWLPGIVSGLNIACRATCRPGEGVFSATPVYPPFLSAPRYSGCSLATAPLLREGQRWLWDWEATEAAIRPETRLFLLCHPHNPVGRAFGREELVRVAELCERHDLVLCSDEIHCGLVLEPGVTHIPTASLAPEVARRTITLMAPSKTYNIPGLGCAFAVISDPGLRRRYGEAMRGIVPHVNTLGYAATEAAYRDGGPWLAALKDYLRGNRDRVLQAVAALAGLATTPVEATYLAWIDARATGLEAPQRFFEDHGVGLSDGRDFGAPGFVRLNFGCRRATLEAALDRMARALAGR